MGVAKMAYKPIDQYGVIGDMSSAALIGTDGSIDWCCFPRFDSPSVFAAILDRRKGGRFQIAPTTPASVVHQSYMIDTNILTTRFATPTGEMVLTDFMPVGAGDSGSAGPHEVHRIVRCSSGNVEVRCDFQPRLDYGRAETTLIPSGGGVVARGNHQMLTLCSQVKLQVTGCNASAEFTLNQGEQVTFVLAYGSGRSKRVETYRTQESLDRTKTYWEAVAASIPYDGMWRKEVVRSFLVLRLLVYGPTGAIVAAPTTSLPESVSGSRNWDYRHAWLRDSSFTMDALYRMGDTSGATRYMGWLLNQCRVTNGRTRIVYGISPNSSLKEVSLDHLEGYRGSQPVRVGNASARHLQLDVFGEVILGIDTLYRNGGGISAEAWSLVKNFAEVVCGNWQRRDRGVWEVRGRQQHFVYSKIMCWVALDRAAGLARVLQRYGEADRWHRVADAIKAEVLGRGWSDRKRAFVQRYDSDVLDASSLVIPFVEFLSSDDPRVAATIDAVDRELSVGPLVRRYNPTETDDGLNGQKEGAFTMLSFWLIGGLIRTGRIEKANDYFEQMLGYSNHLGLFAEMIHPRTKTFLGNFPQAYSHVGLIHTARNLTRLENGRHSRSAAEHVAVA